ncbi:MAG: hypothetical protein AAF598_07365 [Bacteroidota bacterium]
MIAFLAFIIIGLSIAYHDFNKRIIYLWEIIGIGGLVLIDGWIKIPFDQLLQHWFTNGCYLLVLGLFLFVYLWLKTGNRKVALQDYLGLGDLLFFGVISAAFSPWSFMLYFISCCLIGVLYGIRQQALKVEQASIPFAGVAALVFLCLLGLEWWTDWERYEPYLPTSFSR